MSTVFVDTIKNQAGTTSLAANKLPDMHTGSAKTWSCYDSTGTISIRDSFNISGMTDNATGDVTHSFTSSFANDDYTFSGAAAPASAVAGFIYQVRCRTNADATTSSVRVHVAFTDEGNSGNTDKARNSFVIQGELA
jgi:hypothetical protein